jgi:hypothetical protein
MSWLQREFEKSDIGLLSVVTWLATLFLSTLVIGLNYLAKLPVTDLQIFTSSIILFLLLIYFSTRHISNYQIKCQTLAIMLIILVIVHVIGFPAYFSDDPARFILLLFLSVLVYPSYFVYAIFYYNSQKKLPLSLAISCLLVAGEIGYYVSKAALV